jgi:hypothetical protein
MELRFNNLNEIVIEMELLDEVAHLISDEEYLSASNALLRQYSYLSEVLRNNNENSNYIDYDSYVYSFI